MREDILLDNSGDILLSDKGDIQLTRSIAQAIKIKFKWFEGEWVLNRALGIPYYDKIFIKNTPENVLRNYLTDALMEVDGVEDVKRLNVKIISRERIAKVDFVVLVNGAYEEGSFEINA